MTDPSGPRGAASVGLIASLPALETSVVLYLRLWHTDAATRQRATEHVTGAFGPVRGESILGVFAAFCALALAHARRPLIRHAVKCGGLGADEAALVSAAAAGDRAGALLFAALIVRAGHAEALTELAVRLGRALSDLGATGADARGLAPTHPGTTFLKH
jgi:hypothetical protein